MSISSTPGGLWKIDANSGGKAPVVCDTLYTSPLRAREAAIKYVQSTDRLGYAVYPGKPEEKKRKPRVGER